MLPKSIESLHELVDLSREQLCQAIANGDAYGTAEAQKSLLAASEKLAKYEAPALQAIAVAANVRVEEISAEVEAFRSAVRAELSSNHHDGIDATINIAELAIRFAGEKDRIKGLRIAARDGLPASHCMHLKYVKVRRPSPEGVA